MREGRSLMLQRFAIREIQANMKEKNISCLWIETKLPLFPLPYIITIRCKREASSNDKIYIK